MKIEVGEYVRTKNGEIAKIIDIVKPINANILLFDVNLKEIWLNEVGLNIINHSKNIINLIEVRRLCEWRKNTRYNRRIFKNK